MNNSAALQMQRWKLLQGNPTQYPNDGSVTGFARARQQAENDSNWQKLLQSAAIASMMDNKTALGFGLGTLLLSNWDNWFGGKKSKKGDIPDNVRTQYDFSKNMAVAKDPMQMAAAAGDKHAQWVLDNNQPINLATIAQNSAPAVNSQVTGDATPQTNAIADGMAYKPELPFTANIGFNPQQTGQKAMIDSSFNPANSANWFKQNGGMSLGGAWQMKSTPDTAIGGTYEEWLKKIGGGNNA